ncbi:GGDEF domain-containing protein [Alteromonas sp. ASW11-36]|uniref:diguanylate cyclase n=1 Tax=Alteromonas arenosi TaxID=3055817 RepID=A0ABT7T0Z6_9ALTE|nr:GGDEF domain-containing protein [Alteromonas sp. ASW11-36]MDM7862119.1 GGDEF domain-containing protein [Alteromonas sp. ASW11-36]
MLIIISVTCWPCAASVTFEDFINAPPLPAEIYERSEQQRLQWFNLQLETESDPVRTYQVSRGLFFEHYFLGHWQEANALCRSHPPVRKDYYYLESCLEVSEPSFAEYQTQVLELIHQARIDERYIEAAEMLNNLAWKQSQNGDIAGAYHSYEMALQLVPSDVEELLTTIMLDTATNYIIYGDNSYIQKGIALLTEIRQKSEEQLKHAQSQYERDILLDTIMLTHFNTGVAYFIHLNDYEKALQTFTKVNASDSYYTPSSLTFSALAAAHLNQLDNAKDFIAQASSLPDSDETVEAYLTCYRALAANFWEKSTDLSSCVHLSPDTSTEVLVDIYKRLSSVENSQFSRIGLEKLKTLFVEKLEPQLRNRGAAAASSAELRRLQKESDLKSLVLQQQEMLQHERELTHATQRKLFIAVALVLFFIAVFIYTQWRHKQKLAYQFRQLSILDPLTNLGNRRFLEEYINRELSLLDRTSNSDVMGIYVFDIDNFKRINDTKGHKIGDSVLREFSTRLQQQTRGADTLVRWGGEEFMFITRCESSAKVMEIADRLLAVINHKPFDIEDGTVLPVTCTIGVVTYPFVDSRGREQWDRLVSLADSALYYGKSLGKNCWVFVDNRAINNTDELDRLCSIPLQESIQSGAVEVKISNH